MLHSFPPHAPRLRRQPSFDTPFSISSLFSDIDNAVPAAYRHIRTRSTNHYTHKSSKTNMQDLPTEIVQHIYNSLPDIETVFALSATCHQFRNAYIGSQKLVVIKNVLDRQFGPLHDVTQLVTYNESQPAYVSRKPGFSLELARQIIKKGRVANQWVREYPSLKWREDSHLRRILLPHEAFRLRRAIYRFWLFSIAFEQNPENPIRITPALLRERSHWAHQFSQQEIREILELESHFREMLTLDICLSNSMVQELYERDQPPSRKDLLYFGNFGHHQSEANIVRHASDSLAAFERKSWGDDASVTARVFRIMKLSPDLLLQFRDEFDSRAAREGFLDELGFVKSGMLSTLLSSLVPLLGEVDLCERPLLDGGITDREECDE
jgi:hypothetical protein